MNLYFTIKIFHILSSTILFGTGIGIAFFMLRSHFTNNLHEKLYVVRGTVLADYIFTFPAAMVQPLTGAWLVWKSGYSWNDSWLFFTYIIYVIAVLCWLPVVWIQIRLKVLLTTSIKNNTELPPQYYKLFKIWFMLGWPAFIGLVVIFFLMVLKPT